MTLDHDLDPRFAPGRRHPPNDARRGKTIALALVGAAATLFAVARLSATTRVARASRPPEPASLVWEG